MANKTVIRKISHIWSYELDTWEPEYIEKITLNSNRVIRIERLSIGEGGKNA